MTQQNDMVEPDANITGPEDVISHVQPEPPSKGSVEFLLLPGELGFQLQIEYRAEDEGVNPSDAKSPS